MTLGQKKLLQTLFALAALAGLIAYAWFGVEKEEEAKKDLEAKEKRPLESLDTDKLRKFELWANGETIIVERADKDSPWRMLNPVAADGDKTRIDDLLRAAKNYEVKRKVEVESAKLAEYGLQSPAIKLVLYEDGGSQRVIDIGAKFDYDGTYFTRLGDGENGTVQLAESTIFHALNKKALDLREKRLVVFDDNDLKSLAITHSGTTFRIEKDAGIYRLVEPRALPADKEAVDKLLRAIRGNVTGYAYDKKAGEDAIAIAPWGLEPPLVRVEIDLGAKGSLALVATDTVELAAVDAARANALTAAGTPQEIYAARIGGHNVGIFDKKNYDTLKVSISDLRDRLIAGFAKDDALKIVLRKKGEPEVILTRPAPTGTDGSAPAWRVEAPESAEAESYKVSSLLFTLSSLKSKSVVEGASDDAIGLTATDPTFGTVTVYGLNDKELSRIAFGNEDGDDVWVKNLARPWADKVEKSKLTDIFKPASEFLKNKPEPADTITPDEPAPDEPAPANAE